MDLIVRTPHGDAEVTLAAYRRDTTIGDLVGVVTGQAVPPLAAIDGRPMSTETLLADAELLVGSIVSTGSESIESSSGPAVNLVQVTGYGAGSIRRLTPGRFHVGPGRRVTADELNEAPVAAAAFRVARR